MGDRNKPVAQAVHLMTVHQVEEVDYFTCSYTVGGYNIVSVNSGVKYRVYIFTSTTHTVSKCCSPVDS